MEAVLTLIRTVYLIPARYLFVLLCVLIFFNLKRRMMNHPAPAHILAVLDIENGATRLPIMHYETTIGRSKSCDVVIPLAVVSRQHAVLTMTRYGLWRVQDTGSSGGVLVNGEPIDADTLVGIGDEMEMAGIHMRLLPATAIDPAELGRSEGKSWWHRLERRSRRGGRRPGSITACMIFLNFFQLFAFIQLALTGSLENLPAVGIAFGCMAVLPWFYRLIARPLGIQNMAAELAAFFLTTLGICTTASAAPDSLYKQLAAVALGLCIFCVMCLVLKNLNLVMRLRPLAGVLSLLILAVNIVVGVTLNGQKNWIDLGFTTVQPSEFVKILFVFTGAATLEWLLTTKNLLVLTGYAVGCIGCLFLMGDFGTALIFFFAFIVLVFMTSGDVRAIALTCVTAALGGLFILRFRPYIVRRFSAWRHVWDHVYDTGFQQTRALMAIASGGLLGLGGGNGFLRGVFAADTDLVFGILAEEWGLVIAFLALGVYVLFLFSAIKSYQTAYSSYYVIAACTAAAIFLFQACLNVFGTVDVLPLTGVTLPFISNGGSSMAASWGLLSFITASLNYARPRLKESQTVVLLDEDPGAI